MNIVLATDNNFVQHCGVAMVSVLSNNQDVTFYLLTEGLTQENVKLLNKLVHEYNGILNICYVPSDIVKFFPMSKMASTHISIATYYRLFITSLLPESVAKAIYLDCDMVIRGSLEELWSIELKDKALGVVYQDRCWSDKEKSWERLHIPREKGYFNAGMLLMNLDYLRRDNFQDRAVTFINEHFDSIVSHDQDVLNALYYDNVKAVSSKWNCIGLFLLSNITDFDIPSEFDYYKEVKSRSYYPVIIHFASKPKPWEYGCFHKYRNEYYKYLSYTPWRNNKPKFNASKFLNDAIILNIKRWIKNKDKYHYIDKIKKRIYAK